MASASFEVGRYGQERMGTIDSGAKGNQIINPFCTCSCFFHRQTDEEVLVSRLIEKAMRRSRALDTEGLCIVAGEKVWSVRVDIHFLDHDGNLVDAACIAAITALLHFRRPDVTVVGEEVTIHTLEQRNPVPLSIHHIPICTTFAFFDNGYGNKALGLRKGGPYF